jgi:hypothetical protein
MNCVVNTSGCPISLKHSIFSHVLNAHPLFALSLCSAARSYIKYLEQDLAEFGEDGRTLYYLGDSHLGAFERNRDNPGPKEMAHLAKAVEWFVRRSKFNGGHREETWWTTLKVWGLRGGCVAAAPMGAHSRACAGFRSIGQFDCCNHYFRFAYHLRRHCLNPENIFIHRIFNCIPLTAR